MTELQKNKQKTVDLLTLLEQLEVKGSANILIMYKVMSILRAELSELDKQEKEEKAG